MKKLREVERRLAERKLPRGDAEAAPGGFAALRILLGEMMIAAGTSSTVDAVMGRRRSGPAERPNRRDHRAGAESGGEPPSDWPPAADWVPLMLGPAAGVAQIALATRPNGRTRRTASVLSTAVFVSGGVALAESCRATLRGVRPPSLPHLLFSSLGLLGLMLGRTERQAAERPVVRVPVRPRPKVDKIVIRA